LYKRSVDGERHSQKKYAKLKQIRNKGRKLKNKVIEEGKIMDRKKHMLILLGAPLLYLTSNIYATEVAVIMSKSIKPYQDALAGFMSVCNARITEYDMEGRMDKGHEITAKIKSDKPDLILAIGSHALEVAKQDITDIPIVFSIVLNPEPIISGSGNITGASAEVSVESQLKMLGTIVPAVRKIGVVYDPSKTGALVAEANGIADRMGLQLVAREVHSPGETLIAIKELTGKIDALMMLPDTTTATIQGFEYMLLFSFRNKVPLIAPSEKYVQKSALLALSINYEDIGRQSGELANEILRGKSPDELPYTKARKTKAVLNLKTASKIGLTIPSSVIAEAAEVYK